MPRHVRDADSSAAPQDTLLRRAVGRKTLLLFVVGDVLGAGIYALVGEVGAETGGAIWTAFALALVLGAPPARRLRDGRHLRARPATGVRAAPPLRGAHRHPGRRRHRQRRAHGLRDGGPDRRPGLFLLAVGAVLFVVTWYTRGPELRALDTRQMDAIERPGR